MHREKTRGKSRSRRPGKRQRQDRKNQGAGKPAPSVVGELRLAREGYGFVVLSEGALAARSDSAPHARELEDIFVPARSIGSALHSDIVEVRLIPGRGAKPEGRIERVVERRVSTLVGRLERRDNVNMVIADDRRVKHRIIVPQERVGGAGPGDTVTVRITAYAEGERPMRGEVLAVLGARGEEATEREAVIVRHQLRRDFSRAASEEARCARDLIGEERAGERVDLREMPFVTIDGESAEDFDDAVAVQRQSDGCLRLWVSIADVSHFVRPNGPSDREAFERGTSVYFPGFCIPMLPEELSNDLCSLRPSEDRLCFTAEMDIDPEGRVVKDRFYRSVIRSRARLTYTDVKRVLIEHDQSLRDRLGELVMGLELMEQCFGRLRRRRLDRGSIDFDLPEPEIQIDMQGGIEGIVRSERHVGHMMIEEFMIAANESVAEFLTKKGVGCIYRVHEAPPDEKLAEFAVLVHNLGYGGRVSPGASPDKLAAVVRWAHGRPWERLVNHSLLRSMSQAVYSAGNRGHYGLASKCYCHFTSPIRRYPDLMVHRLLAEALRTEGGEKRYEHGVRPAKARGMKMLQEIADKSSRCERRAMEAEREMAKLYAAIFMQDRVGQEFDGVISHVAKFGAFVELEDFFVEGLIHVSALDDDHYIYDEEGMRLVGKRSKRSLRVGDKVRIEVQEVHIPDREILFELV